MFKFPTTKNNNKKDPHTTVWEDIFVWSHVAHFKYSYFIDDFFLYIIDCD